MRQLYYVIRPRFLDECERWGYRWSSRSSVDDKKPLELNYDTFAGYIDEYECEELGERIVYRDDRGFFVEPHSNRQVNLGTKGVSVQR